jgi:3-hydroxyacyl-[acyl-carrier-protein] dehydratase
MLLEDFYKLDSSQTDGSKCVSHIKINSSHDIYRGHFPGRPVTPGVILMQLFKEQAERFTGKKLGLKKASNVKFLAVVNPEEENKLILESEIVQQEDEIKLKGIAKNDLGNSLKINAVYHIKNYSY